MKISIQCKTPSASTHSPAGQKTGQATIVPTPMPELEIPTQLKRASALGQNFEQAEFSAASLQPATSGRPLPKPLREKMESAFDTDFSDVRVHEDDNAEKIGALAYTRGKDLHFAPGQFRPHSLEGKKIIGHELTHVMQQRSRRVVTPSSAVPINTDSRLETEADRLGRQAVQGDPAKLMHQNVLHSTESLAQSGAIQCSPFKGLRRLIGQKTGIPIGKSGEVGVAARQRAAQPHHNANFLYDYSLDGSNLTGRANRLKDRHEVYDKFLGDRKDEQEKDLEKLGGGSKKDKSTALKVARDFRPKGPSRGLFEEPPPKSRSKLEEKWEQVEQGLEKRPQYRTESTVPDASGKTTKYFDATTQEGKREHAAHEVRINKKGLLTNAKGKPINTSAAGRTLAVPGSMAEGAHIFAQAQDTGRIYSADQAEEEEKTRKAGKEQKIHHTTLLNGRLARIAGEIKTNAKGLIRAISDKSGHYRPTSEHLFKFVESLSKSREEGGLGAKLEDKDKKPTEIHLGGSGKSFPGVDLEEMRDIKLNHHQFLQTQGNEAQIRLKHALNKEIEQRVHQIGDKASQTDDNTPRTGSEPSKIALQTVQNHLQATGLETEETYNHTQNSQDDTEETYNHTPDSQDDTEETYNHTPDSQDESSGNVITEPTEVKSPSDYAPTSRNESSGNVGIHDQSETSELDLSKDNYVEPILELDPSREQRKNARRLLRDSN